MQDWRTDPERLLVAAREELAEQSPQYLAGKLIEARNEAIRNEQSADTWHDRHEQQRAIVDATRFALATIVPISADLLEMVEAVRVKFKKGEMPF
jgi:hypothetical protein